MANKTIWGNVSADRKVSQGSGDFQVTENTPTGVFNVLFDRGSFDDVPAVVVTVLEPAGAAGHIAAAEMEKLDQTQFQIVIRSTYSQEAANKPFSFVAIGTE